MGWLVAALVALLALGLLALAAPTLFGPLTAGLAPLLVVVAIIGLGAVWWRHGKGRVDAEATNASDRPGDGSEAGPLGAEDDRVET